MTDNRVNALGAARFIALTTFKKNGNAVQTPMWVAQEGDSLIAFTPQESGKVKRLRNNRQVRLVSSSRLGKVRASEKPVDGTAEVITEPREVKRLQELIRRKYGIEYHLVMLIERVLARRQKPRVILRITLAPE
jgi:uncharacterized protein